MTQPKNPECPESHEPAPSIKEVLAELVREGWPDDGEHVISLLFTDESAPRRDGAAAYDERPSDNVIRCIILEGQIIEAYFIFPEEQP